MNCRIIFIDNFDSFTYNLVDELRTFGCTVTVYRNDVSAAKISDEIRKTGAGGEPVLLVLSPGPGRPEQAHNLMAILDAEMGRTPVLGICLGHQALGLALGGTVSSADEIVHGKSSCIRHHGGRLFAGLPNPLRVARYHSLIVKGLKPELIAADYEGMCMALYDPKLRVAGFQFHPESIMTTHGRELLATAVSALCDPQN